MVEVFPNAPLVELVAQVQWSPAPAWVTDGENTSDEESLDALFLRLRARLAEHGFTHSERLLPAGIFAGPQQAVYRLSNPSAKENVQYLLGPGVFATNAVPPYKSWDKFRPRVEAGLLALLGEWQQPDPNAFFTRIALRYIDAFGDDFLEGKSRLEFLEGTLGFNLSLPNAIASRLSKADTPEVFISMEAKSAAGQNVGIRVGEATMNNEKTAVFDMTVAEEARVPGTAADALGTLDRAHQTIHDTFEDLSQPLLHILRREAQ